MGKNVILARRLIKINPSSVCSAWVDDLWAGAPNAHPELGGFPATGTGM